MSHYRDRREKIKSVQSKSLENLPAKSSSNAPVPGLAQQLPLKMYPNYHMIFVSAGQSSGQTDSLTQTQSTHRLRDTSPRWKEHYSKLSEKWSSGTSIANLFKTNDLQQQLWTREGRGEWAGY